MVWLFLVTKSIKMKRLTNKYILITGASRGLGRELALAFARESPAGLSIVARDGVTLNNVRNSILEFAPAVKVVAIEADIALPQDIERIAATTLSAFGGRLDVLVNNASSIGPSPIPFLLDYPLEDFQHVLNTNLVGPFFMIRTVLPSMIEYGGSIINVTSDAGIVGYAGWGAYGISKFGLEGLSQTWSAELENSKVRVNLVDPGSMNTAMHRAAEPDQDPNEWADPSSVTEVFLFLASDESQYISGMRFQAQENWREALNTASHG
jgi:NAD(P)-dependent dehydrogenase (short-subunit alcohol dehydrogenase family)